MKIIVLHDIVEANGRTIKENNLARPHRFPVGALVELDSGARLFVWDHRRDCDGSPLYALAWAYEPEDGPDNRYHDAGSGGGGFGEDCLTLIEEPR